MCIFFFFKQKTAYDMRISDWSSDVCSSDLQHGAQGEVHRTAAAPAAPVPAQQQGAEQRPRQNAEYGLVHQMLGEQVFHEHRAGDQGQGQQRRSEEHTSELQSLMRISYAVFCLKKKNNIKQTSYQDDSHNQ